MLKKPAMKQKGLKKLPEQVRNKMGFMDKGGPVKNNTEKFDTSLDREYSAAVLKNAKKEGAVDKVRNVGVPSKPTKRDIEAAKGILGSLYQDGGRVGAADMSAKKTSSPKKKQMPQYYMGGGMAKKSKMYSYGGRVAKYKD